MNEFPSVSATQPKSTDLDEAQMPTESSHETILSYQLPATFESTRSGWLSTTGSATTVSSLLAVVGAISLAFFKDDKNFMHPQSAVQEAIMTLNYAAIILSVGATISALSLVDEFGEIPSRASRNQVHTSARPVISFQGENSGILRYFGVRKPTRWFIYHWLVCLLLATLCIIASIITYAATQVTWATIISPIIHSLREVSDPSVVWSKRDHYHPAVLLVVNEEGD